MKMRVFKFLSLLVLLACGLNVRATNSDSLDVIHYGIYVDTIINTTLLKPIHARTEVRIVSTVTSLSTITLDLLRYQVDSIHVEGVNTPFSYDDTLIAIHPSPAPGLGDTVDVTVWYQGRGVLDA